MILLQDENKLKEEEQAKVREQVRQAAIRRDASRFAAKHGIRNQFLIEHWFDYSWKSPRVDPSAIRVAESLLAEIHGERDIAAGNRGGYDSQEVWGIGISHIVKAWVSSGCKDTPKFRCIIKNLARLPRLDDARSRAIIGKKNFSLKKTQAICQAVRVLGSTRTAFLSANALYALGRLSPEARKCALLGLPLAPPPGEGRNYNKWRIRHLNWEAVRRFQVARQEGRANVLSAISGKMPDGTPIEKDAYGQFCPEYRNLPVSAGIFRQLALGFTPVEIAERAGVLLSDAEANIWLRLGGKEEDFPQAIIEGAVGKEFPVPSTTKAARWLASQWLSPAGRAGLEKKNKHGYCLLDVAEGLHIKNGETTPEELSQKMGKVVYDEGFPVKIMPWRDKVAPLIEPPAWVKSLPPGARLLNSVRDVTRVENALMRDIPWCIDAIKGGDSLFFHITCGHVSTLLEVHLGWRGRNAYSHTSQTAYPEIPEDAEYYKENIKIAREINRIYYANAASLAATA